jgi:hypothetical protein
MMGGLAFNTGEPAQKFLVWCIRDFTQSAEVNFDKFLNTPRRLDFITPFRAAAGGGGAGGGRGPPPPPKERV